MVVVVVAIGLGVVVVAVVVGGDGGRGVVFFTLLLLLLELSSKVSSWVSKIVIQILRNNWIFFYKSYLDLSIPRFLSSMSDLC